MVKRVGFTGTQSGCQPEQAAALKALLAELGATHLHHGDCIGADADAHQAARQLGVAVELHPPRNDAKRARCAMLEGEVVRAVDEYLARNRAIVDATEVLVACPWEEAGEGQRSGTWATVRHARKRGRPVVIVRPSGQIEREHV